jgi:UPF0716 protein FxsA
MFKLLVLLFLVVPAIEIFGIAFAGNHLGWLPTLFLVIFTGVAGAWLAKKQGINVFKRAQDELSYGRLPGEAILDGICIFAGGLVLLTPGFFTDLLGFILLVPYTRKFVKWGMKKWIRKKIDEGEWRFTRF